MSTEATDKVFDGTADLLEVCYELNKIASAFSVTGNVDMANTLWRLSESIYNAKESISEGMSMEINQRLEYSQQASASILKAALAGAKLAS
jgi:hypothetical protein